MRFDPIIPRHNRKTLNFLGPMPDHFGGTPLLARPAMNYSSSIVASPAAQVESGPENVGSGSHPSRAARGVTAQTPPEAVALAGDAAVSAK